MYSGADDPVISEKVAKALGCIVRRTTVRAFDAGGHMLPVSGETDIFFSCPCNKHKDNRKIVKTASVFKKTNTPLLIPYSLAKDLDLIVRLCHSQEAQCNSVATETPSEDLDGTEVFDMDQVIEERKTGHLTKEVNSCQTSTW